MHFMLLSELLEFRKKECEAWEYGGDRKTDTVITTNPEACG